MLGRRLNIAKLGANVSRIYASRAGQMAQMSVVTIEMAKAMPKMYNEMPNDALLSMAVMGDQEAREERLIREIMAVDNVDWYVVRRPLSSAVMIFTAESYNI